MKKQQTQDKLAWHLLNSYPTKSLKQYLAYNSNQTTQNEHEASNHFQTIQIPISHQPTQQPTMEIQIQLGDGKPKIIKIYNKNDIQKQAQTFCRRHKLNKEIKQLLIENIHEKYEQFNKEKDMQDLFLRQQQMKQVYSNVKPHEVLINIQSPQAQIDYEQPLFEQIEFKSSLKNTKRNAIISHNDKSNLKKSCTTSNNKSHVTSNAKSHIHQLRNTKNQNKQNQPQINKLSEQICNKKGKDAIILERNKRSQEKMRVLMKQKAQRQQQIMKQCQFKPKINAISKKVDRQLQYSSIGCIREEKKVQRYERLYENYKEIESKRQQVRKNSLMKIPFKPSINLISKRIMENKSKIQDYCHLSKDNKSHHHCSHEDLKYLPKTGRKPRNRNHEGLPIGQYLYNEGMKKSKSKAKFYEDKKQIKASQHSDYLVSILKQKRIHEIFTSLTSPPHQILECTELNLNHHAFKYGIYRYFIPIFNEMIELDISLSRQQFLEASLRLFKILSPEEKHEVIFKKDKENDQSYQNSIANTKNRQSTKSTSRFQGSNLYNRGMQHKKMLNQKIQKNRQDKVREQLKKCTFRPDIYKLV